MTTPTIRLSADLAVDAIEYASRANAILGIRDSGKTYTGSLIAEQLDLAGIPFFVFDPIGRWRFLRQPGKGPSAQGFKVVVAGGVAPDLPLTPDLAPTYIRAAMQSGVSMVLDLYSVELSKSDWRAIVRNAIETILYEGEGHGLRHVFLEEAAEFIPQRVRDGNTYAAVEKLARMGGNVGVGVTLINQRAEEVNKAVLELCDNLILHRQRGKNSLISLEKWLTAGNVTPPKEITRTLADLPTGQCWAWFKDVGKPKLIKIAQKRSFDPNRREMRLVKAGGGPRAVDVSDFLAKMKAALAGKPVQPVKAAPAPPAPKPAPVPRPTAAPQPNPMEAQVDEKEAKALRDENTRLNREVNALRARLDGGPAPASNGTPLDMDAVFEELKRRASADPTILQIFKNVPEIEVLVERRTIQIDGTSLKGRLARMIVDDFFNEGVPQGTVRSELKRTGPDVNQGNLWKALAALVADGFLTLESGKAYRAVEGMKVNVVEK